MRLDRKTKLEIAPPIRVSFVSYVSCANDYTERSLAVLQYFLDHCWLLVGSYWIRFHRQPNDASPTRYPIHQNLEKSERFEWCPSVSKHVIVCPNDYMTRSVLCQSVFGWCLSSTNNVQAVPITSECVRMMPEWSASYPSCVQDSRLSPNHISYC